jgi:hypothetical protein
MSQGIFSSIVPTTTSGNQLAQILNDFKDAIVSGFSGSTRPAQLQAGGYWIDTTNNPTSWTYKFWTGVQDITVFTINLTTGQASFGGADNLFEISRISADDAGAIFRFIKARVANNGQTLIGDVLGQIEFAGTRETGARVVQARLRVASIDDVTGVNQGSSLVLETIADNQSTLQEIIKILDQKIGLGGVATPLDTVHARGNVRADTVVDSTVGPKMRMRKRRVSTNGQVLSGDILGDLEFLSTDQNGAEIIGGRIRTTASENHTDVAQGTRIGFFYKRTTESALTEFMFVNDNGLNIEDLIVTNLTATNTILGNVVEAQDAKFILNKGGTKASALAAPAGFEIEMSDETHVALAYDDTLASKWKIGSVGSLKEVITAGDTQTLTNKTLTGATINNPARAGVKEDTEANLTTYATTATNGQWAFATDTKVMYQIVDGELIPAGAGGGGVSLNWKANTNAPFDEFIDGLDLKSFDDVSSQEIFATLSVPQSYRPGKPIRLLGASFFANITAGNVFFKAQATLIKAGLVLGTYPNTHNSSNTQVTVPATPNELASVGVIDLTSSIGEINSVAVAPGDKIRIRLFRDNAAETSSAAADARLLLDGVEPTFS